MLLCNESLVLVIPRALRLSSFTVQIALSYDVRDDSRQLGRIRVMLFDKSVDLGLMVHFWR